MSKISELLEQELASDFFSLPDHSHPVGRPASTVGSKAQLLADLESGNFQDIALSYGKTVSCLQNGNLRHRAKHLHGPRVRQITPETAEQIRCRDKRTKWGTRREYANGIVAYQCWEFDRTGGVWENVPLWYTLYPVAYEEDGRIRATGSDGGTYHLRQLDAGNEQEEYEMQTVTGVDGKRSPLLEGGSVTDYGWVIFQKKKGKKLLWGMKDRDGNILLEPKYQYIDDEIPHTGLLRVQLPDGSYKRMDINYFLDDEDQDEASPYLVVGADGKQYRLHPLVEAGKVKPKAKRKAKVGPGMRASTEFRNTPKGAKKRDALVSLLKKNKSVQDPEALAGWIGLRAAGRKGGKAAARGRR